MLESVAEPPRRDDPDRGWLSQYAATAGHAALQLEGDVNVLLVEFPYGAHSAGLIALHDAFLMEGRAMRYELLGSLINGTGARFHVREASDESGHEVVTLDYVEPLRDDRPLATMPTQTVYYRLRGDGFIEVGRGEVYDSLDAPWDIPRAVEPFLSPEWVKQQRT